jgi:methyl-accepting chemotaxis protein-1 (serine sensor receptor)
VQFSQFSIGARLGTTFAALVLIVLAVSGFALRSLGGSDTRFQEFVEGVNARANTAAALRKAVDVRAISARNLVLVEQPAELAAEKAVVLQAHGDVQKLLAQLTSMARAPGVSPLAREKVAEIERIERNYGPVAEHILELATTGRKPEAIAEMNAKCRPLLAALIRATDDYAALTEKVSSELVGASHDRYGSDRTLLVAASTLAIAFAVLAGWLVTRSITGPIGQAVKVAQTVAAGDLRSDIRANGRDETARLLLALRTMNEGLVRLVGEVRQSSDSIATGSGQIATGNADLSQRTEQQASSLQETAASMRQLTSTVQANADTARQATDLASTASSIAAQGGEVVGEVVATMQGISAASRKIADITAVIDGIAFQTNILALNAAVEAARAGEQGRGFAVVAGEVRSLAQRSAEAAREIKALITDSVQQVETGSAQVTRAGRTMAEIVGQVRRVNDLIANISAATQQQSAGIGQVGEAVGRLDEVTQQNAALVEQSAAAATSLNQQATRLVEAVGVFTLHGGSPSGLRAA